MKKDVSTSTNRFVSLINRRTQEDQKAFECLYRDGLYGNCFSILRQELDSMIRVIYLLHSSEDSEREKLIEATLSGKKWSIENSKGKSTIVTDKEMAKLSNALNGWTLSVYRFGCAFIHLSNFHDYQSNDPFASLDEEERVSIIEHMANYHSVNLRLDSTMEDIVPYLQSVLNKIIANLKSYLDELLAGKKLIREE